MNITINIDSPVPVYKQIVMTVISGVYSGELGAGTILPPIRQLASDLKLTTATVAKAYQILERSRIIITGGRRGTFIGEHANEQADRHRADELSLQIESFIALQIQFGMDIDQIESTFTKTIEQFKERGRK